MDKLHLWGDNMLVLAEVRGDATALKSCQTPPALPWGRSQEPSQADPRGQAMRGEVTVKPAPMASGVFCRAEPGKPPRE